MLGGLIVEIHHYIQNWKDYKRVIVVSVEGSVFVDLYQQPLYDFDTTIKSEIWALYVGESFRNKGIAKQLLQYAENIVKQFGESCVALVWNNSTPLWVLEWYKKSGYKFCKSLNDVDTLLIKEIKD